MQCYQKGESRVRLSSLQVCLWQARLLLCEAVLPWKHDAETDEDVPDPDVDPLELSFDRFVASEGTDRIYLAEVALWH